MFGDGQGHAGDVHLLERVASQQRHRHIAGDRHDRNRVHIRGGDAGDQIGGAGAGGGDANAHLAGGTGIAVGGVRRALFVRGQHMADAVRVFIKFIVQIQHCAAGIAEQGVNALLDQHFDEDL